MNTYTKINGVFLKLVFPQIFEVIMRIVLLFFILNFSASVLVSQENKPFSYKDDRELFERVVRVEEALNLLINQMNRQYNDLKGQTNRQYNDLKGQTNRQYDDLKGQTNRQYDDLKDQKNRRFTDLKWFIGVFLGAMVTLLAVILAKILSPNPSHVNKVRKKTPNELNETVLTQEKVSS